MKSLQVLRFDPDGPTLELRARDYSPAWMSAVAILDDDTYLGQQQLQLQQLQQQHTDAPPSRAHTEPAPYAHTDARTHTPSSHALDGPLGCPSRLLGCQERGAIVG